MLPVPPSLPRWVLRRAAYNDLCVEDISPELYKLSELTTLDLSHNKLSEMPDALGCAGSLIVLSLSHNRIRMMPPAVLIHLTELEHLDLSHNQIAVLPPQLRHLAKLQTLVLSGNPLGKSAVKAITGLEQLTRLEMRSTGRTVANVPPLPSPRLPPKHTYACAQTISGNMSCSLPACRLFIVHVPTFCVYHTPVRVRAHSPCQSFPPACRPPHALHDVCTNALHMCTQPPTCAAQTQSPDAAADNYAVAASATAAGFYC